MPIIQPHSTQRYAVMDDTFRITTQVPPSRDFMPPHVLEGHLAQLRHYEGLRASGVAPLSITDEAPLSYLSHGATHGSITGLTLDRRNGRSMVGLSVNMEKPRFLFAGDFIATHLGIGFGMPMSLKGNGRGFVYPRFRINLTSQELRDFDAGNPTGWNIYLNPVIANAHCGQTVEHHGPLAELSNRYNERFDHRYHGRDALLLRAVEVSREAGKKARTPRLGRDAFIAAALCYFDRNAVKAGLPITREAYVEALAMAFSLADWRYGPVGYGLAANRNDPLGAVA